MEVRYHISVDLWFCRYFSKSCCCCFNQRPTDKELIKCKTFHLGCLVSKSDQKPRVPVTLDATGCFPTYIHVTIIVIMLER